MTDQEFSPVPLPIISGDLWDVCRKLERWADERGLPRHDEPGVELVPPRRSALRWVWEGCWEQVFLP